MQAKSESNTSFWSVILKYLIKFRTIIILIALIVIFTLLNSVFVNPINLLNILKRQSFVFIVGFGMTFIITLAGLDLSVGSVAAVTGVGFSMLVKGGFMHPIPALLIMLVVALALGFFNGFVSVKGRIEPFLVTLATMNMFRGLALILSEGKPIPIVLENYADIFGNGEVWIIPTPVIITIVLFALSLFLYKKTKFGFYVRCIGGNPEAARVAGIKVNFIKVAAYTLNAFFAFIAGLILSALFNSGNPDLGKDLPLDAISGVILGGTAISGGNGRMWGTFGGCLIIAVLSGGMSLLGLAYSYQILVKGSVIILAMLLDNYLKRKTRD